MTKQRCRLILALFNYCIWQRRPSLIQCSEGAHTHTYTHRRRSAQFGILCWLPPCIISFARLQILSAVANSPPVAGPWSNCRSLIQQEASDLPACCSTRTLGPRSLRRLFFFFFCHVPGSGTGLPVGTRTVQVRASCYWPPEVPLAAHASRGCTFELFPASRRNCCVASTPHCSYLRVQAAVPNRLRCYSVLFSSFILLSPDCAQYEIAAVLYPKMESCAQKLDLITNHRLGLPLPEQEQAVGGWPNSGPTSTEGPNLEVTRYAQPQAPKYRYPHPHDSTGAKSQARMYRNSRMSVAALLPAFIAPRPCVHTSPCRAFPGPTDCISTPLSDPRWLAGLSCLFSLSTSWLLLAGWPWPHALEGDFTRLLLPLCFFAQIALYLQRRSSSSMPFE